MSALFSINEKVSKEFAKKFLRLVLATSLLLINLPSVGASEQQRKVAVLPFSFRPTDDIGDVDVGDEVAKVLSSKISKLPGWAPVDQNDVSAILQRQDTTELSGAEIGRLLGVDAIITGNVQTFEFDMGTDKSGAAVDAASTAAYAASSYVPSSSGVPYLGSLSGIASGLFGSLHSDSSPRGHTNVVIDAKLIDVYTGKELAVLSGNTKSRKSATDMWGSGGPNPDFLSTSFATCIAGQTTFAAADEICKQLVDAQAKVDALAIDHSLGTVTDIDDALICVNAGKKQGFKIGDKFNLDRDVAVSTDPSSHIGTIVLTNVGETVSLGKLENDQKALVLVGDVLHGINGTVNQSVGTVSKAVSQ